MATDHEQTLMLRDELPGVPAASISALLFLRASPQLPVSGSTLVLVYIPRPAVILPGLIRKNGGDCWPAPLLTQSPLLSAIQAQASPQSPLLFAIQAQASPGPCEQISGCSFFRSL